MHSYLHSWGTHNWQRTRYSDGLAYGVWYGSPELETTVYETVHHWHRFVMDSFPAEDREIVGERRVLDVRCDALLVDLRGREKKEPRLKKAVKVVAQHPPVRHPTGHGKQGAKP